MTVGTMSCQTYRRARWPVTVRCHRHRSSRNHGLRMSDDRQTFHPAVTCHWRTLRGIHQAANRSSADAIAGDSVPAVTILIGEGCRRTTSAACQCVTTTARPRIPHASQQSFGTTNKGCHRSARLSEIRTPPPVSNHSGDLQEYRCLRTDLPRFPGDWTTRFRCTSDQGYQ